VFELDWREADVALRDRLAQYVDNRRKTYEAFARFDPDANYARDAKQRLDDALRVQAEIEANIDARARLSQSNR
jgi:hypothetical protein